MWWETLLAPLDLFDRFDCVVESHSLKMADPASNSPQGENTNPAPASASIQQTPPPNTSNTVNPSAPQPTQALREDLVINAVNFLKNPNVASTPLARRIAFLEHKVLLQAFGFFLMSRYKGLTQDEINEAMARVSRQGGVSPSVATPTSTSPVNTTPANGSTPATHQQPVVAQPPQYAPQYYPPPPYPPPARPYGVYPSYFPPPSQGSATWKIVALTIILTAGLGGGIAWLFKVKSSSHRYEL